MIPGKWLKAHAKWQSVMVAVLWTCGMAACGSTGTPPAEASATPPPTLTSTLTATATIVWFPPTATPTVTPPLPTPTPTPDLRPGIGDLLFRDDFSTADEWALSSGAGGSVALGKNELSIAIAQPKTLLFSLRSAPVLDDFYVEITAAPTLCRDEDEYGLLVRAATSQNYYRFSAGCNGQARLVRVSHGETLVVEPWTLKGGIPLGAPSSSRLAVWAVGKEMRFFVNDWYQFTVQDSLFPSGTLGVFARAAGEDAMTVSFSDLVVRVVER